MKYLTLIMISVTMLIAVVFAADFGDDEVAVIDRGYECFNLEVAQAQLAQARVDRDWRAIIQARASVRNWEKLCPMNEVLILEG